MNAVGSNHITNSAGKIDENTKVGRVVKSSDPAVMADIYDEDINLVIWQRQFPTRFKDLVDHFVTSGPRPRFSTTLNPKEAHAVMLEEMGDSCFSELADDISELVEMFCFLFGLNHTGLRMRVLRDPMCPKFHVDHVPCRMVTTYSGVATEWLPHRRVNREKLGLSSADKSDHESGLYEDESDVQKMVFAEVALMKGEGWKGNQNAGLVHRSPTVAVGERRLILTLDFSS